LGLFDAVVDFDTVTPDPSTGEMEPEDRSCVPDPARLRAHALRSR
jgi:hypothetical protein